MKTKLTDDFHSIVLNQTPLLDVRAPIEFEKGTFINSFNIPILDNEQRRLIGIEYKKNGNDAAVKLGEKLIKNEGREKRVKLWKEYLVKNPNAILFCFRGGQRSGISQTWLSDAGVDIKRIKGGYKVFRNYLMNQSLEISQNSNTLIVGGRTGSGKTILINKLNNSIDLEGIANHRGSSFGKFTTNQPSQIDFENNLSYKLIQFKEKKFKNLVIEHESLNIGRCFIPKDVYSNLTKGKLILLETPMDIRVNITYEEYIVTALKMYDGVNAWAQNVQNNLDKIKKRLGNEFYTELNNIFNISLKEHIETGNIEVYKEFVKLLLEYVSSCL